VSVYRQVFTTGATKQVQSAVPAEWVIASTQIVADWGENSVQLSSFCEWVKPACSTDYPIRNGYVWVRKFPCSYWVAYSCEYRLSKIYIRCKLPFQLWLAWLGSDSAVLLMCGGACIRACRTCENCFTSESNHYHFHHHHHSQILALRRLKWNGCCGHFITKQTCR